MEGEIKGKKNICIFIKYLSAGGAEKQAILLSEMLSSYHNVFLVLYNKRIDVAYEKYLETGKFNLFLLEGNIISKTVQLIKFLKKENIEIIFCYLLLANFLGGIAGKLANVKYRIGGVRSSLLEKRKEVIEKIIHNFINSYTIFNNYAGFNRYIQRGFRESKCLVIPNFINVSEYVDSSHESESLTKINSSINHSSNNISILSVGRFVEAKDYNTSLEVIRTLVDQGYSNISYTIIGYGDLENEIRSQIKNKKLSSHVKIFINPKDVFSFYKNADIYLMTSVFEGLSNTIMEAMCFKLPIVATNVGDNGHLVENEKNGFLTQPKEVDRITSALIELIENNNLRISYGLNSYNKIKSNYSEHIFKKNYLNLINSLE